MLQQVAGRVAQVCKHAVPHWRPPGDECPCQVKEHNLAAAESLCGQNLPSLRNHCQPVILAPLRRQQLAKLRHLLLQLLCLLLQPPMLLLQSFVSRLLARRRSSSSEGHMLA